MTEYGFFAVCAAIILYALWCEVDQKKRNEYDKGYKLGRDEGYHEGYTYGYRKGHSDGREQGYRDGKQDGYEDGRRYEAVTAHNKEQLEKMIAEHDYNISES